MKQQKIEDLIGNTPLVRLQEIERQFHLKAKVYAKIESKNLGGSIKDRVAQSIIDDAEKKGLLKKGGTIIEATSGNTGIGLALLASLRGYKAIIVMPDTMSKERIKMITAYGGEVVLTDGKLGMQGAVEQAQKLQRQTPNSILADQFNNPACVNVHFERTGKEIYAQTDGNVDIFVAGIGTGGTVTGAGKYLKFKNKQTKVIGVEPASSPLLTQGVAGPHAIQGIGANFIPTILDVNLLDDVLTVTDEEALYYTKVVSKTEGLFVGLSSGACLCAGVQLASMEENTDKTIVLIFPDDGGRYLSIL